MAIRTSYNGFWLKKADRESEMGSMAAAEGDKEAAKRHFEKMHEYNRRAREEGEG